MENRIYIRELVHYKGISIDELKAKYVAKNPYYDLSELPSGNIKEEVRAFLLDRSKKVDIATFLCGTYSVQKDMSIFKPICEEHQQSGRHRKRSVDEKAESVDVPRRD